MSATDELRRLLDERGVEWESKDVEGIPGFHDTRWNAYGVQWCYAEFVGNNYTKLIPSSEFHCTPEQAIAATLGNSRADYHGYEQAAIEAWESIKAWNARATNGTLTAEQVKRIHEIIEKHWRDLPAEYDMPEATALPEYSYDWQAIADELNSRAERTCKQEERGWSTEGDHARVWLTCGHDCMVPTVQDLPNYCPNCGARVVE